MLCPEDSPGLLMVRAQGLLRVCIASFATLSQMLCPDDSPRLLWAQGLLQVFPPTVYYFRVNMPTRFHLSVQSSEKVQLQNQSYPVATCKEKYQNLKHDRRSNLTVSCSTDRKLQFTTPPKLNFCFRVDINQLYTVTESRGSRLLHITSINCMRYPNIESHLPAIYKHAASE